MPEREIIKMLLYRYAMDGCGGWTRYPSELEDGSILEEAGEDLTGLVSLALSPSSVYVNRQVEEWADALLAKWTLLYAELAPTPTEE